LSERSELFSETQFMKNISKVVDDFTRKIR
jgi:hypothetical protein